MVVIDASALVELLLDGELGQAVARRIGDDDLHAPGHADAEVLSALGRLNRAGELSEAAAGRRLEFASRLPLQRHPVAPLMVGAWSRRWSLRLTDALYVELAESLGSPVITTDLRLARATPIAKAITA